MVAEAVYWGHDARIVHDLGMVSGGVEGALPSPLGGACPRTRMSIEFWKTSCAQALADGLAMVRERSYCNQREVLQGHPSERRIGVRHGGVGG